MSETPKKQDRFSIDPEAVAQARAELRAIVKGIPIAEAAVAGFSDWQVIEAMERLLAVGVDPPPNESRRRQLPPPLETGRRL